MTRSIRNRVVAATSAAALAAGVVTVVPARADTIAQDQAEAAALTNQIQASQQQLDQLAAQYEQSQFMAGLLDLQLQQVQAQLATTQSQAAVASGQLRKEAVTAYLDGGIANEGMSVLMQGNASNAALGRAYLTAVTGDTQAAIDSYDKVASQLRGQADRLSQAEGAVALNMARMAAERSQAQAVNDQEVAALAQVKGRLATLVTQDEMAKAIANAAAAHFVAPPTTTLSGPGGQAVSAAESYLGVPYVWGGASRNGVDCSGLVMLAWQAAGVNLPRVTYAQAAATPTVPMSSIQPGDLVFYNGDSHVAMYVGNGTVIEALHTGTNVGFWSIGYAGSIDSVHRP